MNGIRESWPDEQVKPASAARSARWVCAMLILAGLCAAVAIGGSTNAACGACHRATVRTDAARGVHGDLACYSCHLEHGAWDWPGFKLREVLVMYPKALVGGGLADRSTVVASAACERCHREVFSGVTDRGGIRIAHASCAEDVPCSGCHGRVPHGDAVRWQRFPVMEECVACHRMRDAAGECDVCHSKKSEWERLGSGPWQATHGPAWKRTHGMGTLSACATCHRKGFCSTCHDIDLPHPDDFGRTHGELALRPSAKCARCHDRTAFCDACHGVAMPHPDGFLVRHSSEASSYGDPRCLSCHQAKDCRACHEMHVHPGSTQGSARLPAPGAIGLEGAP